MTAWTVKVVGADGEDIQAAVGALIRDARTFMLPGVIQTGRKQGMRLMDDSLMELYDAGIISADECMARAEQKLLMKQHLSS